MVVAGQIAVGLFGGMLLLYAVACSLARAKWNRTINVDTTDRFWPSRPMCKRAHRYCGRDTEELSPQVVRGWVEDLDATRTDLQREAALGLIRRSATPVIEILKPRPDADFLSEDEPKEQARELLATFHANRNVALNAAEGAVEERAPRQGRHGVLFAALTPLWVAMVVANWPLLAQVLSTVLSEGRQIPLPYLGSVSALALAISGVLILAATVLKAIDDLTPSWVCKMLCTAYVSLETGLGIYRSWLIAGDQSGLASGSALDQVMKNGWVVGGAITLIVACGHVFLGSKVFTEVLEPMLTPLARGSAQLLVGPLCAFHTYAPDSPGEAAALQAIRDEAGKRRTELEDVEPKEREALPLEHPLFAPLADLARAARRTIDEAAQLVGSEQSQGAVRAYVVPIGAVSIRTQLADLHHADRPASPPVDVTHVWEEWRTHVRGRVRSIRAKYPDDERSARVNADVAPLRGYVAEAEADSEALQKVMGDFGARAAHLANALPQLARAARALPDSAVRAHVDLQEWIDTLEALAKGVEDALSTVERMIEICANPNREHWTQFTEGSYRCAPVHPEIAGHLCEDGSRLLASFPREWGQSEPALANAAGLQGLRKDLGLCRDRIATIRDVAESKLGEADAARAECTRETLRALGAEIGQAEAVHPRVAGAVQELEHTAALVTELQGALRGQLGRWNRFLTKVEEARKVPLMGSFLARWVERYRRPTRIPQPLPHVAGMPPLASADSDDDEPISPPAPPAQPATAAQLASPAPTAQGVAAPVEPGPDGCPNCHQPVGDYDLSCAACGWDLVNNAPGQPRALFCPLCGMSVSLSDTVCPKNHDLTKNRPIAARTSRDGGG